MVSHVQCHTEGCGELCHVRVDASDKATHLGVYSGPTSEVNEARQGFSVRFLYRVELPDRATAVPGKVQWERSEEEAVIPPEVVVLPLVSEGIPRNTCLLGEVTCGRKRELALGEGVLRACRDVFKVMLSEGECS